jgi:hypothetical protein
MTQRFDRGTKVCCATGRRKCTQSTSAAGPKALATVESRIVVAHGNKDLQRCVTIMPFARSLKSKPSAAQCPSEHWHKTICRGDISWRNRSVVRMRAFGSDFQNVLRGRSLKSERLDLFNCSAIIFHSFVILRSALLGPRSLRFDCRLGNTTNAHDFRKSSLTGRPENCLPDWIGHNNTRPCARSGGSP